MILVEADEYERGQYTDGPSSPRRRFGPRCAKRWSPRLDGAVAAEVSVKFTSDEEVLSLNAAWRGKDKATNVLSFPMVERELLAALVRTGEGEALLGDIVLAHGVCAAEAADKGLGVCTHAAHLVVHGTLHLLGYDHERGDEDAETMEATERRSLAALGIADPYEIHH